jgi:hypothetical protein
MKNLFLIATSGVMLTIASVSCGTDVKQAGSPRSGNVARLAAASSLRRPSLKSPKADTTRVLNQGSEAEKKARRDQRISNKAADKQRNNARKTKRSL